jgi:type II secretory pathway pseudopilin PulG
MRIFRGLRSERGYTLVEMLVSTAIMVGVTGAIFSLMNPAQGSAQAQPEVADQQQRMRVAQETLFKELMMAGAGPYMGTQNGSLLNFFAPILPRRGGASPDARNIFRADAITLTYIPNTSSQTTIRDPMPPQAVPIKVEAQPGCPDAQHNALCGFVEGMEVLIFDDTGTYDTFTITSVQDEALQLRHQGQVLSKQYDTGSRIAQATKKTFYLDAATSQLNVISGDVVSTLVDNVVGLEFSYFGDPNPPTLPRPKEGNANCLYDAQGNHIGPGALPATSGSLVALPSAILIDGPFCGGSTNEFDADLLRIRKVRVTLRVQTGVAGLRSSDPSLFTRPGSAAASDRVVPDYRVSFEVTPRNLNLSR